MYSVLFVGGNVDFVNMFFNVFEVSWLVVNGSNFMIVRNGILNYVVVCIVLVKYFIGCM